jgi:hypothetical protein
MQETFRKHAVLSAGLTCCVWVHSFLDKGQPKKLLKYILSKEVKTEY